MRSRSFRGQGPRSRTRRCRPARSAWSHTTRSSAQRWIRESEAAPRWWSTSSLEDRLLLWAKRRRRGAARRPATSGGTVGCPFHTEAQAENTTGLARDPSWNRAARVTKTRATVAPQSTPIEGGYRAPQQRFPSNQEPADLQVNPADLTPQGLASNPGSGTHKSPVNAGLSRFLLVHSRTNPAKISPQRGVARPDTGPWQDRLAPVGRSSNWQSQPSVRARSAPAASSRRSQGELRASPAVSAALSRRQSGPWKRHRRAVRACGGERGSGGARRAAAPRRRPREP